MKRTFLFLPAMMISSCLYAGKSDILLQNLTCEYVPGDMNGLDVEIQTLYGKVQSSWKREDGKIRLRVVVPCNTTARLMLPVTKQEHTVSPGVHEYVINN